MTVAMLDRLTHRASHPGDERRQLQVQAESEGERGIWKILVAHIWKIVWLNFRWTKTSSMEHRQSHYFQYVAHPFSCLFNGKDLTLLPQPRGGARSPSGYVLRSTGFLHVRYANITFIMLVVPGTPTGTPAVMTTTSPSRTIPEASAALTERSSRRSVFVVASIKTG